MTQIGEAVSIDIDLSGGDPPPTAWLTITIREMTSDEPIEGVTVSLTGPSPGDATTNMDGEARFSSLTAGAYTMTLEQAEFEMKPDSSFVTLDAGDDAKHEISVARIMTSLVLKRLHIKGIGQAARTKSTEPIDYGHWWIEVDGSESYGWWPKGAVSVRGTFTGVPGSLNGQGPQFRGTPTRDPHHGDDAEEMFHPRVMNAKPAAAIKADVRAFASGYSGTWSWPFGQNCHSFQKSLMAKCELTKSGSKKAS